MARCAYCDSFILLGGKNYQGLVFCNDKCLQGGHLIAFRDHVTEDLVNEQVIGVHQGNCPKCNGRGPVDIHTSHSIWSALVLTSYKSTPAISCRPCGVKKQVEGGVTSLFFGWWGFPWGLVMTPVQITRNLIGLCSPPNPMIPSENLRKHVRMVMVNQLVEMQKNQPPPIS